MRTGLNAVRAYLLVVLAAVAMASWLVGCAPAPPRAVQSEPILIGLSVDRTWFLLDAGGTPGRVYLAHGSAGTPLTRETDVVHTNFQRENRFYLLNAAPGDYAPVAVADVTVAGGPDPGRFRVLPATTALVPFGEDKVDDYRIDISYLPAKTVQELRIAAAPGAVVFLGHLRVDRSLRMKGADDVQRHFDELLTPRLRDPRGLRIGDPDNRTPTRAAVLALDRSPQAERAFLEQALRDLAGTEWEARVRQRLQALQAGG